MPKSLTKIARNLWFCISSLSTTSTTSATSLIASTTIPFTIISVVAALFIRVVTATTTSTSSSMVASSFRAILLVGIVGLQCLLDTPSSFSSFEKEKCSQILSVKISWSSPQLVLLLLSHPLCLPISCTMEFSNHKLIPNQIVVGPQIGS